MDGVRFAFVTSPCVLSELAVNQVLIELKYKISKSLVNTVENCT